MESYTGEHNAGEILPLAFYRREGVTDIARELLGKELLSNPDGEPVSGLIIETEAYAGVTDRASHAYGGRYSARTEVMYRDGGVAYIYLCYGIHSMFNVVTNKEGIPDAVLIRAIWPVQGIAHMQQRAGSKQSPDKIGIGPGKVARILGLHYTRSGLSLTGPQLCIRHTGLVVGDEMVVTGPRIGVAYAGEDALLPYRFRISGEVLRTLPQPVRA